MRAPARPIATALAALALCPMAMVDERGGDRATLDDHRLHVNCDFAAL